jgi:hypothetical protein
MSTCGEFFQLQMKKQRARNPKKIAAIRAQMRAHVEKCPVCSGRIVAYRKPRGKKLLLSINK